MTVSDAVVPLDPMRVDPGLLQAFVQQARGFPSRALDSQTGRSSGPGPRSCESPSDSPGATTNPSSQRANVTTLKSPSGNSLRMKGRLNSPVFGSSRCEPAMCTLSFAQPGERQLAGGGSGDDLHAADLFHHAGKKTGGRVATGQHEPFLSRFFLGKHDQVRAAICPSGSLDDAIGFRHVVRRGADRNADPARSDLADAHGLPFRRRCRAEHFGGQRLGRLSGSLLQRKQLFDRHLQLAREIQRNFGIGNVRPGFDRVDRLAAHVYAARQVGRAHASGSFESRPAGSSTRVFTMAISTLSLSVIWAMAALSPGLEMDLAHEFEHAGIARAGDRTERRASEASVGIVQRRGVRHVESFRAEFEVHALRECETSCRSSDPHSEAPVREPGCANWFQSQTAARP